MPTFETDADDYRNVDLHNPGGYLYVEGGTDGTSGSWLDEQLALVNEGVITNKASTWNKIQSTLHEIDELLGQAISKAKEANWEGDTSEKAINNLEQLMLTARSLSTTSSQLSEGMYGIGEAFSFAKSSGADAPARYQTLLDHINENGLGRLPTNAEVNTPGTVPGSGPGMPGPGMPGPGFPGPGAPGPGLPTGPPGPGFPDTDNDGPDLGPGPGTSPGPGYPGPGPGTSPGPGYPGPGTGLDTGSTLAGLGPGGAGPGTGLAPGGGLGPGGAGGGAGLPAGGGPGPGTGPSMGTSMGAGGRPGGMGMMPGMMGRGQEQQGDEQERSTWLSEDDDIWDGQDAPPGVID